MSVCLGLKDAVQGIEGPSGWIHRETYTCLLELQLLKLLSDLEQAGHPYCTHYMGRGEKNKERGKQTIRYP